MSGYERYNVEPRQDTLRQLKSLVTERAELLLEAEQKDKELKALNERVRQIDQEEIPSLMDSIGLDKVELRGGLQVTVKDEVYCSLPKERRERAMQWLDDHEHGGLIKRSLEVLFDREQEEEATELLGELKAREFRPSMGRKVEPSTLKAFLKEQLREGQEVPLKLFGAYAVRVAKVQLKK